MERHSDLSWSVTGHVAHVADSLRLRAERVAGVPRRAQSAEVVTRNNAHDTHHHA